jgi:glycine/serine hydroxymethyltransferase
VIPDDPKPPLRPSGIRIGTPERLGYGVIRLHEVAQKRSIAIESLAELL